MISSLSAEPKNKAVGNFGVSAINCYMAMAIVLDDMEMYKKAIDIYLYGYENGSIQLLYRWRNWTMSGKWS